MAAATTEPPKSASDACGKETVVQGEPLYVEGEASPTPNEVKKRFVTQGWRDKWWIVPFVAQVILVIALGITAKNPEPEPQSQTANAHGGHGLHINVATPAGNERPFGPHAQVHVVVLYAAMAAFGVAAAALALMKAAPRQFIVFANVVTSGLMILMALVGFGNKQYWGGFFMLLCGAGSLLWLYCIRDRIPFSAVLLETSVTVTTRHYGTFVTAVSTVPLFVLYSWIWIHAAAPTLIALDRDAAAKHRAAQTHDDTGRPSDGEVVYHVFATLMLLLAWLWTVQVVTNVSHVTTSGTVATWYFAGADMMPPHPTVASLKRAMTTSFGSICFGSLLVATVKLLYYIGRCFADQEGNDFVRCVMLCILNLLDYLIEKFNVYAYTHVAIYGSSFVEAGMQTWEMVKNCGWAAFFNDALCFPVLEITSLFGAICIGVVFGLVYQSAAVGITVFLMTYGLLVLLLRPIYSSLVTMFVCVAECPDAMAANPDFSRKLNDAVALLGGSPIGSSTA